MPILKQKLIISQYLSDWTDFTASIYGKNCNNTSSSYIKKNCNNTSSSYIHVHLSLLLLYHLYEREKLEPMQHRCPLQFTLLVLSHSNGKHRFYLKYNDFWVSCPSTNQQAPGHNVLELREDLTSTASYFSLWWHETLQKLIVLTVYIAYQLTLETIGR